MPVKTNITNYTLNKENILRDFDMAGLSFEVPNKKKSGPKELFIAMSQPYNDYGIVSTFIERRGSRQYFYYLGEKGHTQFEKFRKDLQALQLPTMVAAPVRVYSRDFEDEYILLQLLFGYLGAQVKKWVDIPYGNYIGHIYADKIPYTKDTKDVQGLKVNGDTIVFNRINYSRDKTIYVNVETWMPFEKNLNKEKKSMRKTNKFVMELDDYCTYMVRVPWEKVQQKLNVWKKNPNDTDPFKNWYVKGTYLPFLKNGMPNITFIPDKRLDDKLKIYIEFLDRINSKLGQYVTLTPVDKEFDTYPIARGKKEKTLREELLEEKIRKTVLSKGIIIYAATKAQCEKAKTLRTTLIQNLALPESIVSISQTDISDERKINPLTWNIQIVDNKESYVDENKKYDVLRDIYKATDTACLQHIYTETISNNPSTAILNVILTELLLKDALLHRQMPDFMIPERKITVAVTRKLSVKLNGEDKLIDEYFALTIENDGSITETLHFTSLSDWDTDLKRAIVDKFDMMNSSDSYKTLKTPEGIIRFDDEEFCGIYRTTQRPLPDYRKLLAVFKQQDEQKTISIKEAIDIMDGYCSSLVKDKTRITSMYEAIKEELISHVDSNGNISIKTWFSVIRSQGKNQTPIIKMNGFDSYLNKAYPDRFIAQTHVKKEQNNPYEIDHLTGIHYADNDDEIEYYVGLRKVSSFGTGKTYHCGFPIRIVENDGSFSFPEFAKMLDIIWVRRGSEEPTVLPYPFKILREYIKSEDNKLRGKNNSSKS